MHFPYRLSPRFDSFKGEFYLKKAHRPPWNTIALKEDIIKR